MAAAHAQPAPGAEEDSLHDRGYRIGNHAGSRVGRPDGFVRSYDRLLFRPNAAL